MGLGFNSRPIVVKRKNKSKYIMLCYGTDMSVGDCLKLTQGAKSAYGRIRRVFGTTGAGTLVVGVAKAKWDSCDDVPRTEDAFDEEASGTEIDDDPEEGEVEVEVEEDGGGDSVSTGGVIVVDP